MALRAASRLSRNPNSNTLYLAIPSDMVKDSQFPFKSGEAVALEIRPRDKTIVISSIKEDVAAYARYLMDEFYPEEKSSRRRSGKRQA
jgi:hypothetical protein